MKETLPPCPFAELPLIDAWDHLKRPTPAQADPKSATPPNAPAKPRLQLSAAQAAGLDHIRILAQAFFSGAGADRFNGLCPRLKPLIVGPSGVGKTFLARLLAEELKLPILRLCFGGWLVTGAKDGPPTLSAVANFVKKHEQGIIYLDELDKCRAGFGSDWQTSMIQELFGLLDGTLQTSDWPESLRHRLNTRFFFLGAGTWQEIWTATRSVGFGGNGEATSWEAASVTARITETRAIPEELLFRFNDGLVVIPPMSAQELQRMAESSGLAAAAAALDLPIDYVTGAAGRKGMRWLEAMATAVIVQECIRRAKRAKGGCA